MRAEGAPGGTQSVPRSLPYLPALDGLRALAVAGVLCYHQGFSWARGGFLGVSTFFTLSGFLIARLLRHELRGTGRIDLRRFWTARARRLLPAALLTLLAVLALHRVFDTISYARLRGDVLAALGYSENWWLIHTSQSYAALFGAASPIQHFWSLAVEEQFYLVFPLACYGLHRSLRRPSAIALAFAGAALASFGLGAWVTAGSDPTTAYYRTDIRIAELLVGAALGYTIAGRAQDAPTPRARRDATALGAFAVLALLWARVDLTSSFLFRGATALNALATAVVIVACLQPGVVTAMLSVEPLRYLGRISYGVYLVHWPIFLWLRGGRGTNDLVLFATRCAITLAVASVMFVAVERPVRVRSIMHGRAFAFASATVALLVLAQAIVFAPSERGVVDLARAPAVHNELAALRVVARKDTAHSPHAARRILVVGDSLAWTVSTGLHDWAARHGVDVEHYTAVRCGIGGPGELDYLGLHEATGPDCAAWHASINAAVTMSAPDIVLVVIGLADLSPRRFPDGRYLGIGDPTFDARLRDGIVTLTRGLHAHGARVVWATYPHVDVPYKADATGRPPFAENETGRVDRLNALIRATTTSLPGTSIVDFAAYCIQRPGGEFGPGFRPDGVHLTTDSTREVAKWLGPQLLARA